MRPLSGQTSASPGWSGTEFSPGDPNAWDFDFDNGDQNDDDKNNEFYAWAVRPGE